jgi:hypothetical protein
MICALNYNYLQKKSRQNLQGQASSTPPAAAFEKLANKIFSDKIFKS